MIMTTVSSTPIRRAAIASSATCDPRRGYFSAALNYVQTSHTGEHNSANLPREAPFHPLQRIAATRRSDRGTAIYQSRIGRQATIESLLRYWGRDFDRRLAEPQPDPLSQFKAETEIAVPVHETPIVFVVDDDVSVRESLESLVRSAGWRSETFKSAQEFLSRPRVLCPSCLVLDVTLPDLNGLELQKWVAVERPDMPIIFITGHGDVPMTVQAMKGGALEFLTKPFRGPRTAERHRPSLGA
jgi:CheY-like chemotaxis protein